MRVVYNIAEMRFIVVINVISDWIISIVIIVI